MLVLLKRIITEETDYEAVTESDPHARLNCSGKSFNMVITDLKMPKMDGIAGPREGAGNRSERHGCHPHGVCDIENAVEAIQKGAYDYITKPSEENEFSSPSGR